MKYKNVTIQFHQPHKRYDYKERRIVQLKQDDFKYFAVYDSLGRRMFDRYKNYTLDEICELCDTMTRRQTIHIYGRKTRRTNNTYELLVLIDDDEVGICNKRTGEIVLTYKMRPDTEHGYGYIAEKVYDSGEIKYRNHKKYLKNKAECEYSYRDYLRRKYS